MNLQKNYKNKKYNTSFNQLIMKKKLCVGPKINITKFIKSLNEIP